ncbi:sugar-phosphate:phosphate translocator, DMT family [Galdieria sulphuraria]|uniref:Putative hexose phosphate translocator n=1 Tax=Galdieria sulphuraria TaxID=130081 RepID=B5AJT1_GALSU|nr:sugar-phosphate:phosphate translocator, DMT family [Galdieria sulphuraria]ACF72679.1 putative hexose phosphate translocator [Galdieria sulphuraria]EME27661.1 sugar-phosphate:phosphate translocator, DMT family [Galdieria sulphuraria]|eukprot:XP_005704181.1 sugar-phosphate:phosphate translocator, DMT family [Galdieria sulphuraria]
MIEAAFVPLSCSLFSKQHRWTVVSRNKNKNSISSHMEGSKKLLGTPRFTLSRSQFLNVSYLRTKYNNVASSSKGEKDIIRAAVDKSESGGSPQKSSVGVSPTLVHTLKVGFYFFLWYFFNFIFNIANKRTLNMWKYPWVLSTIQLGVGALYCTFLWVLGLRTKPNVSKKLIKALIWPSLGHTLGHAATCMSFSLVAISFTHVVKSAEPVFGAVGSALVLGEFFHPLTYLTLVPIVSGVALSAATELTFTWTGFITAMISNVAFVTRNITSKFTMVDFKNEKTLIAQNTYALITIISFFMELPFALLMEGFPPLVSAIAGVSKAKLFGSIMFCSLFYHLYNEVSYLCLDNVSPVSFSIGNTIKRVIIIFGSILVFRTPVTRLNFIGSTIAIIGTMLYSLAKAKLPSKREKQ